MDKILSFIVNENNEFLLLKGNSNDPQFNKSFWYTVTGGCEQCDKTKTDTVRREILEETGLSIINNIMYLNWIFKYNSLSKECIEYAYIAFVKNDKITLNDENTNYKWCDLENFIEQIHWFGNKETLRKFLELAINKKLYFEEEKIDSF